MRPSCSTKVPSADPTQIWRPVIWVTVFDRNDQILVRRLTAYYKTAVQIASLYHPPNKVGKEVPARVLITIEYRFQECPKITT